MQSPRAEDVHVTAVLAAGDAVEGVDIPADENVTPTYPIASLTDAGNREGPGHLG